MEWLALIIPVVLSLLALLVYKHKLVFFELLLPVVASIIFICIMKVSMVSSLTTDTEYLTSYVTSAKHVEEWDEYISKTCSRTTYSGSGKNQTSHTTYYDCSYVSNHPEYWEATTNVGQQISITKSRYQFLRAIWKNEHFVEMDRNYHRIDGDGHATIMSKDFNTVIPIDYSKSYSNKPQTAHTIFHFEPLDSTSIKHVKDYPEIINSNGTTRQKACIGCTEYENITLRRTNGLLGAKYQIKVFVLVFKNQSVKIAEKQRQHWSGGNKNELVICVDADSKWAKSFSWSDDKLLEYTANNIFMDDNLTLTQKLNKLHHKIPKLWKRKNFSDFDYIDVMLTNNQMMWIYIVTFVVSIICLVIGIRNDIDVDK